MNYSGSMSMNFSYKPVSENEIKMQLSKKSEYIILVYNLSILYISTIFLTQISLRSLYQDI